MTSYAEQAQHNPALKAYVQAEIARAHVRLASLEAQHQKDLELIQIQARTIQEQAEQIKALEKKKR